jgi:hypothetical protein
VHWLARLDSRERATVVLKMADELLDISKLKVGIYTVSHFIILSEYKNNMW